MPPVFGRRPNSHPYDAAITVWLTQSSLEYRSMARNLMHDHRVSVQLEQSFDNLTNHPRTDLELRDALIDYKEDYVKNSHSPRFIDARVNGNNIVSGSSRVRQIIHKDAQLVRVLDLNGLGTVFQWAKRRGHAVFTSFPTRASGYNIDKWLSESIRRLPREQFVKACLDVMNDYRRHHAFQPTWAVAWRKFKPFSTEGADRWIQVMGMHRPFAGRWLMLLCYRVREAGTVTRPTQLDVGWGPYHFPSPPHARVRRGGHPMNLGTSKPITILLSEFIHQQIDHNMKHWIDAGRGLERTLGPTTGSLDIQRNIHHHLLVSRYGRDIFYWMPRCI